ncbi:MAG: hypothetical protein ACREXK_01840 [Gammaproteobacteria bacterium]
MINEVSGIGWLMGAFACIAYGIFGKSPVPVNWYIAGVSLAGVLLLLT